MSKQPRPKSRRGPARARVASSATPALGASPRGSAREHDRWLIPAAVAVVALVAFVPALSGEFLEWDDDRNFLNNAAYRGLGSTQLHWMLTSVHMGHYIPVTWITLGFDYLVWGMNPFGYHLTNVLLHAVNAVLVYGIARRLLDFASPAADRRALSLAAACAALLFAVHPLRVESVAWITERRDVLSGFFYLSAVLAYLRACDPVARERSDWRRWYAISLASFVLALFSKSMSVTLPVLLLVLDIYPLGRLGWPLTASARRALAEKIPFIFLSLLAGAVAVVALAGTGNMSTLARVGGVDRVAISVYSLAFYLWKAIVPIGLSPLYELPAQVDPLAWPFAVSAAVVAGLTALAFAGRRRWPALAAVWTAYVVILLPVVGIVHNGHQIAADRYTYLATIGWMILIAGGLLSASRRFEGAGFGIKLATMAVPAVCIVLLSGLTWAQSRHWRTTEALWTHALSVSPFALGYMNMGIMRDHQGRLAEAVALHERALALRPDLSVAQFNMALTLRHQGRLPESIQHFERALALKPADVPTHTSLAAALLQQGRWAEAAEHGRRALAVDPNYPEAHNNLAAALGRLGDLDGSIRHYERAIAARPSYDAGGFMVAVAEHNLGNALLRQGRIGEAVARLRQAVRINPTSAEMHNSLAVALARDGRLAEAASQLEEAIRLEPTHAQARENLRLIRLRLTSPSRSADQQPSGAASAPPRSR